MQQTGYAREDSAARIVDLSHHLANGMPLYPGIPDPVWLNMRSPERVRQFGRILGEGEAAPTP